MTLSAAPPLRRGSTPLPIKHQLRREEAVSEDYDWTPGLDEPAPPPVSISGAQGEETLEQAPQGRYHGPLRIVLLGQNGVGKSSLALLLAGQSDRSLSLDSESSSGKRTKAKKQTNIPCNKCIITLMFVFCADLQGFVFSISL